MIQQLLPSGYYIFLPTFLSLAEYLHKQQMNIKVEALDDILFQWEPEYPMGTKDARQNREEEGSEHSVRQATTLA